MSKTKIQSIRKPVSGKSKAQPAVLKSRDAMTAPDDVPVKLGALEDVRDCSKALNEIVGLLKDSNNEGYQRAGDLLRPTVSCLSTAIHSSFPDLSYIRERLEAEGIDAA